MAIEKIKIKKLNSNELKKYKDIVREVAEKSGQHVGEYVNFWFESSEKLFLYRDKNTNKAEAFIIFGFLDKIFLIIPALMVSQEYQDKKISSELIRSASKDVIKERFFKLRNPFIFYIIFRTQNPKLYSIVSRKADLFPSPENSLQVTDFIKHKVKKIIHNFWPDGEFDENNFVLRNAYINTPNLIISPEQIKWSGNKKIDDFIDRSINLSHSAPHALVVLGRVNLIKILIPK